MSLDIFALRHLKHLHGAQLIVASTERESSILFDAVARDPAGREACTQFNIRDARLIQHIEFMLDRDYCVGVLPAGANDVVVFSSPTLRFPGTSGPGASRNQQNSSRSTVPAAVRRADAASDRNRLNSTRRAQDESLPGQTTDRLEAQRRQEEAKRVAQVQSRPVDQWGSDAEFFADIDQDSSVPEFRPDTTILKIFLMVVAICAALVAITLY